MGIILIAFIILGTFLMVFVNQFWDTRNLKKAKEDLNSYVLLTTKALENNNGQLEVKDQETFNLMIDLSRNSSYKCSRYGLQNYKAGQKHQKRLSNALLCNQCTDKRPVLRK